MIDNKILTQLYEDINWRIKINCFNENIGFFLKEEISKAKNNNMAMEILSRATNANFVKKQEDIYEVVNQYKKQCAIN